MGFLLVLKAEFVRNVIVMRRYWFRTLTGMIIGYFMLFGMIVMFHSSGNGAGSFASRFHGPDEATRWALSFIIGMFAFGIVGLFSQGLQQMAQSGQLEQLCMSPHGLVSNFMARSVMAAVTAVPTSSLMVWLISYSVGFKLPIHGLYGFGMLGALMMLSFFNLIGFGFLVGGLVLVFKQTGQVAVIVRMALLGIALMAEDVRSFPLVLKISAHVLPITDATLSLIHLLIRGEMQPVYDANGMQVMQNGVPLAAHVSTLMYPSFMLLIINTVAWTLLGIICFRIMENWSRNKGTLGAY